MLELKVINDISMADVIMTTKKGVVYIECISSRVSHQSCHFLTAVQLLLQMVDGWLGRGGSILVLYRLLGSIQVLETGSMGTFSLIVITEMNHRTAVGF